MGVSAWGTDVRQTSKVRKKSSSLFFLFFSRHFFVVFPFSFIRHVYASQLDIRLEYCLLAASLLKTALTFSLPYPTSDINFIQFNHTHMLAGGVVNLFPGVELFSDPFRCCPAHLLSTLRWCSEELVKRRYSTKVSNDTGTHAQTPHGDHKNHISPAEVNSFIEKSQGHR